MMMLLAAAATATASTSDAAVAFVAKHTNRTNTLHPSKTFYPDRVYTPASADGTLAEWHGSHAPGSWTSGFWVGVNWQLAALTGEASWAQAAAEYAIGLEPTQFNNRTHDVGFIMYYSYGLGFTANESLRPSYGPPIFQTALSLGERFNPKVGCTESWSPGPHCNAQSAHSHTSCPFTVIIDNLMNLEILLFAALNVTDDHCGGCTQAQRQSLLHIAESHATTAAANHVRPDGSIVHIVCYDPRTGEKLFTCNGGGFLDNTTWARGQAWALYGFTMVYRYTHKPAHLATATKVADFFVGRLSDAFPDHVPNFDLTYDGLAPLSNLTHRDASAAAIAASGLLELAEYVDDAARAKSYRAYSALAVKALSGAYASDFEAQEGAITHCDAANCDVPWADYYLLEAIGRAAGAPA